MPRTTIDADQPSDQQSLIYVLAILGAAMATAEIMPGSMMPLMAEGLGTTEGLVGQSVTASAIVAIITSLSIGRIAGNRDRRHLLIVLTLALVISNLGVTLASSVWAMLASRLLLGAAIGIIWGLLPAIVLRISAKGQFAKSYATVLVGVSIASVIAAPLAAWLGAAIGWRYVYLGGTLLAVIAFALLVLTFPSMPARTGALDRDLRGSLKLPGLLIGMGGLMLLFGGAQTFFGYMVPFLKSVTGLSPGQVSIVLLATGMSGLLGTIVAPRSVGISLRGALVAGAALLAFLLGVLLLAGHLMIPAMLILMLWMFTRAHLGVGANAWIAHNYSDHVESVGGILVAVIQGSMMLGAILGGVLIDTRGASAPPVASAIILTMGAVYCVVGLKPRDIASADPDTEARVVASIVIADDHA